MANSVVRPHVPEDELHAYCDGELSPPQRVEIAEHLLGCLICRSAHAEVEELRARTARLLAIAAPKEIAHRAIPRVAQPARRRFGGRAAAAAIAVIGAGVWFSLQPDARTAGPATAATAVVPGLLGAPIAPAAAPSTNELVIRDSGTRTAPSAAIAPITPAGDVDPAIVDRWHHRDWNTALVAANGSLARIGGVLVTAVRVRDAADGVRPDFVVRQELGDGRPIWVFDGPADRFAAVDSALQTTGMSVSRAMETVPNYAVTNLTAPHPARTVRVAGFLPADSLNALARKITLR